MGQRSQAQTNMVYWRKVGEIIAAKLSAHYASPFRAAIVNTPPEPCHLDKINYRFGFIVLKMLRIESRYLRLHDTAS